MPFRGELPVWVSEGGPDPRLCRIPRSGPSRFIARARSAWCRGPPGLNLQTPGLLSVVARNELLSTVELSIMLKQRAGDLSFAYLRVVKFCRVYQCQVRRLWRGGPNHGELHVDQGRLARRVVRENPGFQQGRLAAR